MNRFLYDGAGPSERPDSGANITSVIIWVKCYGWKSKILFFKLVKSIMDERDCMILQYLSEDLNLTKAAERLYITQPALTYRIQQIEKQFNARIIVKTGKGIRLTAEGERIVTYAKKMLIDLRNIKDFIESMRNEEEGILRIGVPSYYGLHILPRILGDFLALFPRVQFNVTTGLSDEIYQLLMDEDIHVAIVHGDFQWVDQKFLIQEEHISIIYQGDLDMGNLPSLPRISYKVPKIGKGSMASTHASLSQIIENWWFERYKESPTITMQVDSYETCKEMVKHGLGYAIIPNNFIKNNDQLQSIQLLNINGLPIKRNNWMLYREIALQYPIVDRFVKYFKNVVRKPSQF